MGDKTSGSSGELSELSWQYFTVVRYRPRQTNYYNKLLTDRLIEEIVLVHYAATGGVRCKIMGRWLEHFGGFRYPEFWILCL